MGIVIKEPNMIVRIDVSMERYQHILEEVVYYRAGLPMRMTLRWKWYFEYIAARIKVKHPKRQVKVTIIQQPSDLKVGSEYIREKTRNLLRTKYAQVRKLQKGTDTDLFDFAGEDRRNKIDRLQSEIAYLESGRFPYYYPVEYKNIVKKWI